MENEEGELWEAVAVKKEGKECEPHEATLWRVRRGGCATRCWEGKACHSEGRGDFTMAEDEEGLMSSNVSLKGPGSRG